MILSPLTWVRINYYRQRGCLLGYNQSVRRLPVNVQNKLTKKEFPFWNSEMRYVLLMEPKGRRYKRRDKDFNKWNKTSRTPVIEKRENYVSITQALYIIPTHLLCDFWTIEFLLVYVFFEVFLATIRNLVSGVVFILILIALNQLFSYSQEL